MARYFGVGAFVNLGGYGFFLFFLKIGLEHKLSASLVYVLGTLVSYLLNRKLVFDSDIRMRSGLPRLCLALFCGYGLNLSILYLGVDFLNYAASVVQLLSIVCVSLFLYFANRFYIHRGRNL